MPELDRRVSLKMEEELYQRLAELAKKDRGSISNMIIVLLEQALETREEPVKKERKPRKYTGEKTSMSRRYHREPHGIFHCDVALTVGVAQFASFLDPYQSSCYISSADRDSCYAISGMFLNLLLTGKPWKRSRCATI